MCIRDRRNAGMDFGYAKWGSVSSEGIDHPDLVFESPLDLLKLLEKNDE